MPRMSCKGARRLRIALTILPFFQRLGRVYKHTAEQLHVNIAVQLLYQLIIGCARVRLQKLTRNFPIPVPASTSKLQAMYTIS